MLIKTIRKNNPLIAIKLQLSYVGRTNTKPYLEKLSQNLRRDLEKDNQFLKQHWLIIVLKIGPQADFVAAEILSKPRYFGRRITIEALHNIV